MVQDSPTWLEVDPTSQYLVAVHEYGKEAPAMEGLLTSYKINQETGALTKVCSQQTHGRGNTAVTFDRTGKFLLTTRYWEGGVTVLPFDPTDGTIGAATATPMHEGTGAVLRVLTVLQCLRMLPVHPATAGWI